MVKTWYGNNSACISCGIWSILAFLYLAVTVTNAGFANITGYCTHVVAFVTLCLS